MHFITVLKHLRVVWCMLETFCFGGLHIGWASLVYVFKHEGFFTDGCQGFNTTYVSESEPKACDYQDAQMSLLFGVSNGISIIPIMLCGNFLSRFGQVKTRIIWICLFILGCIMMIISTPERPWFACVGVILLAGGGSIFLHSNMQISRLYTTGSFFVIALINGCYDSSSAVTLFMKLAYEAGVDRRISFAVIIGLSLTAFLNTYVNFTEPELKNNHHGCEGYDLDEDLPGEWTLVKLYKKYVCNKLFISHFMWFTFMDVQFVFFISTSNVYIGRISDKGNGTESSLTNFLSITMLIGIVTSIVAGLFFERLHLRMKGSVYIRNLKTSMIAIITTTLLSAVLAAASTSHNAVVASSTFVILPIFRSFLFSSAFIFIAKIFPARSFGALVGVLCAWSSIIFVLQIALFQWFQDYEQAELHIRILFLLTSLVAMHHPILIFFKIRREKNTVTITDGVVEKTDTGINPAFIKFSEEFP